PVPWPRVGHQKVAAAAAAACELASHDVLDIGPALTEIDAVMSIWLVPTRFRAFRCASWIKSDLRCQPRDLLRGEHGVESNRTAAAYCHSGKSAVPPFRWRLVKLPPRSMRWMAEDYSHRSRKLSCRYRTNGESR